VDRKIFRSTRQRFRPAPSNSLLDLITVNTTSVPTVLPATATCLRALRNPAMKIPGPRNNLLGLYNSCIAAALHGHEKSLLAHTADYAGVLRGLQLQNAREAGPLQLLGSEEVGFSRSTSHVSKYFAIFLYLGRCKGNGETRDIRIFF
jgi:hypothetical protein